MNIKVDNLALITSGAAHPDGALDFFQSAAEMRNLKILNELASNSVVSQRGLSRRFGFALGLTNACLKKMVQKGWISTEGIDGRRVRYALTLRGIEAKSELTRKSISSTLRQYSDLKEIIAKKFLEMKKRGIGTVVFFGVTDEMEVAYIALRQLDIGLAGIVEDDETFKPEIMFGYRVQRLSRLKDLRPEAILITSVADVDRKRTRLCSLIDSERVYVQTICDY
jgi:DNA-binding MarR family transcriptional regulator